MNHKLICATSIDSLIKEIDQSIEHSFLPTLAFIFLSIEYDLELLRKRLSRYSFIVVGSTTYGEIYANSSVGVHIENQTITCMLLELNRSAFALKIREKKELTPYDFGVKMAKWSKKRFNSPALLTITAGLCFDNERYIEGLQHKVSHIFGAVAGDDKRFEETFIFSKKKIVSFGALVLAFDTEKIEVITSRCFGWSGIGTQRVVTKSQENLVSTIDDKPAVEFYKDYLNISSSDMPDMGVDYPLEVLLQNGQKVYRAALQINEDGSLIFTGDVPEGAKVRISAPIGMEIINYAKKSIDESLASREDFKADFSLVFPCASHKNLLGSYAIEEIEAIYHQTQKAPLVGFYAYGEIASSMEYSRDNAFHNETFVTVQLREKR